jgi:pentatricopeptide repeat protein
MQVAGIIPDRVTVVSALSACANLGDLSQGKWIHAYIMICGFELGIFVGTSLIGMYAKCGRMEIARQLFDKMRERNIVSWNTMIAGYAESDHPKEAFEIFNLIQLAGVKPNSITMLGMLAVCSRLQTPKQGKSIHRYIIREGYESDIAIGTAVIDMYAKCKCLDAARQVFDKMYKRNVVSWSAMIAGYVQNGRANEALILFDEMQLTGVKPNSVTMLSVLTACTQLGALHKGKCIHDQINRAGFESDVSVQNCLIDM